MANPPPHSTKSVHSAHMERNRTSCRKQMQGFNPARPFVSTKCCNLLDGTYAHAFDSTIALGPGPLRRSAGPACLVFFVQAGADSRVGKSADPNHLVFRLRSTANPRGIYPTIRGTCYVGRIILETMALEECLHVAISVLSDVSHPGPLLVGLWPDLFSL
jgi:hypothetical protein